MDHQEKRAFKNHLYEQFARIGKALSSSHRLELLEVLAQGEHSVEALAQETGMSVANASQHLQVLRVAQLVEVRREGVYIYYRLGDERVFRLWQAMREVGEARIAEIERIVQTYLHERTLLQPISAAELRHGPMALVRAGFPVLIFAQNDETRGGVEMLAAELVARQADVMLAGSHCPGAVVLPTEGAHAVIEPMLIVQSFYRMVNALSLARGYDPDRPPYLNKVTETV